MALKITVTLPNSTSITLEADEPETYVSLASLALKELPSELVSAAGGTPARQPQRDSAPPTVPEGWDEFHGFCQRANPLGDMRRVVVAAEVARRFLDLKAVSPKELASLFEAAGWTQPTSFVQTLRNAARSIFRWMERVPGRRGYYTVTDKGRQAVLGKEAPIG